MQMSKEGGNKREILGSYSYREFSLEGCHACIVIVNTLQLVSVWLKPSQAIKENRVETFNLLVTF